MKKKKMIGEQQKKTPLRTWQPDFHWLTDACRRRRLLPDGARRRTGAASTASARSSTCGRKTATTRSTARCRHRLPSSADARPRAGDASSMLERGVAFVRERTRARREGADPLPARHRPLGAARAVRAGRPGLGSRSTRSRTRRTGAPPVSPSRSQYDGWAAWLTARGMAAPDYHSFGCIAYRHLANG